MKLTVGKVVSWLAGILIILIGLTGLLGSIIGGLLLILVGVFSLPPVRRKIKQKYNLSFSRWLVALIVVIGFVSGALIVGLSTNSDNSNSSQTNQQEMITKPSSQMLPTIEDFDTGWQLIDSSDTHAIFLNVDTQSSVGFNVSVHDSIQAAETDYTDRRETITSEGTATDDVDIGDEGFMVQRLSGNYGVYIRVANVVGHVEYSPSSGVLTAESNAKDFARMFRDNIVE